MLGFPTRADRSHFAVVASWFALRLVDRAALAAVAGFFLLYGLGAYGILNDNESLYALAASHMLAQGSFGVPMLNGVPYIEKPPLLSWLLAAVYAIAGQSEAASRSIPVMATWILIGAMTLSIGAYTRRRIGWLTGLILASSIFQILIFRTLLPEALLVLFFSLAMLAFVRWHVCGSRAALVSSYACLGMAVLAKGFVALTLGFATFLVFAMAVQRRWHVRELAYPPALFALIVIAGAWPAYLAIVNPDYAWFFVVNEHVLRYLGLREPRDYYGGPCTTTCRAYCSSCFHGRYSFRSWRCAAASRCPTSKSSAGYGLRSLCCSFRPPAQKPTTTWASQRPRSRRCLLSPSTGRSIGEGDGR
jgi:4-amino-4-deoxy-L-arabinose transferase-like glycosyltransferase